MRLRLAASTRWIPVVTGALVAVGAAALFYGGYEYGQGNPIVRVVHEQRARISPTASLAEVRTNITGKSYVHAPIAELPGFVCDGWSNGKAGHGWVVLVCTK